MPKTIKRCSLGRPKNSELVPGQPGLHTRHCLKKKKKNLGQNKRLILISYVSNEHLLYRFHIVAQSTMIPSFPWLPNLYLINIDKITVLFKENAKLAVILRNSKA
jgi:hypothetical protein